jgi:streptomycin 6-kinase
VSDHPPGHPHVRFEHRNGRDVVIKRGDQPTLRREAATLALLGEPAVEVIDLVEFPDGAAELITQRVLPGDDLRPMARIDDDAATRIIAELVTTLRRNQKPIGGEHPRLPDLMGVLGPLHRCTDPRLPGFVKHAAVRMAEELVGSGDAVVLHGDLQHRNIARCRQPGSNHAVEDWTVIDPHGWWGDAAFETVAMLVAPDSLLLGSDVEDARGIPGVPLMKLTQRRIHIVAEVTGDDPDLLRAWALVGAAIAEARMLEQHNLVHGAPLALAQALMGH